MQEAAPPRIDRRHRRREQTIEEILEVATQLMSEQGAAGLSLGEVARRMGIRTPSLYTYFDSKNALYDAVFERGWQELAQAVAVVGAPPPDAADVPAFALSFAGTFARWGIEHPAFAQLMFWRPVPGYEPSPAAYAAAVRVLDASRARMAAIKKTGALRRDVDVDSALRLWTVLISGVVSQQLANAPEESFETGTFTASLPDLVSMFFDHFGPAGGSSTSGRKRHHATSRR